MPDPAASKSNSGGSPQRKPKAAGAAASKPRGASARKRVAAQPAPVSAPAPAAGDVRAAASPLIDSFLRRLTQGQARNLNLATPRDHYISLAMAVRDVAHEKLLATRLVYESANVKRAYYLSLEVLLGRSLKNNLLNLGLLDEARAGLSQLGLDLDQISEVEPDAGLGNGGLGRLAACYLDSAATLRLPVYGYSLRYDYGIFEQEIVDGWQVERPDYWLRYGSVWETPRPELATPVRIGGHLTHGVDALGHYCPSWVGDQTVIGVPYDVPVVGYDGNVNLLRLWAARAAETLDLETFNRGGYLEAVREQARVETITKVLYPNDATEAGRQLRLTQQYFFVACTLADIVRRYERSHDNFDAFPDKVAIQLNDTHPSLGIVELMRLLVDEHGMPWERAWELCGGVFAYTNHTLLPEALEVWPAWLMERVLPRHLQIIYEINRRFLDSVSRRWPNDAPRAARMSLVQETPEKAIRMAALAIVGSHRVNGVAKLHSELLKSRLVPDFAAHWPERFVNKTNGVTPRRWLALCNPRLAGLITSRIGNAWMRDLTQLIKLEPLADDEAFQEQFYDTRRENKARLAHWIRRVVGVSVPTDSLYDVQVKRLHEYKRQLLNVLSVVIRYQQLLDEPEREVVPRTVIFGAKAAPAYARAKLIIKLIHDVAAVINHDERVNGRLRVVFLPNYGVSLAELVIPAADLSEQISTAGTEASGTGNMKFALNGALTIGTLDGANIEIREAVGHENFFLFGLTADEVAQRRAAHDPWKIYHANGAVRRALDALSHGHFSPGAPARHRAIVDWLTLERDYYMLLADIDFYLEAQQRVDALWASPRRWGRAAILNMARIGFFSSDRAVEEYAREIWRISPISSSSPATGKPPPANVSKRR